MLVDLIWLYVKDGVILTIRVEVEVSEGIINEKKNGIIIELILVIDGICVEIIINVLLEEREECLVRTEIVIVGLGIEDIISEYKESIGWV